MFCVAALCYCVCFSGAVQYCFMLRGVKNLSISAAAGQVLLTVIKVNFDPVLHNYVMRKLLTFLAQMFMIM